MRDCITDQLKHRIWSLTAVATSWWQYIHTIVDSVRIEFERHQYKKIVLNFLPLLFLYSCTTAVHSKLKLSIIAPFGPGVVKQGLWSVVCLFMGSVCVFRIMYERVR